MLTKDDAICIRAVDYSETSQIVTLFTRANGKVSAIAKGSKRAKSAFDGPVEMFSYGRIVFTDSTKEKLATLTEFEQQSGLSYLAGNLFAANCACFAAELVNSLANESDPHPGLFDSFLQFIQNIQHSKKNLDRLILLILFQLALLKEVGLQPILNACANCKTRYSAGRLTAERRDTRYEIYFSSSANGLICRDCETAFTDKIRLSKPAANALNNFKLLPESKGKTLREIEKILVYHFTEILGKAPKMAKHILKT